MKKIIVVEDSNLMRFKVAKELENYGFEIIQVTNGKELILEIKPGT